MERSWKGHGEVIERSWKPIGQLMHEPWFCPPGASEGTQRGQRERLRPHTEVHPAEPVHRGGRVRRRDRHRRRRPGESVGVARRLLRPRPLLGEGRVAPRGRRLHRGEPIRHRPPRAQRLPHGLPLRQHPLLALLPVPRKRLRLLAGDPVPSARIQTDL